MTSSLRVAIVAGSLSRGCGILLRFFTLPLTLSLLTVEQYGVWMVLSSSIMWLGFSDLGIPAALQNRLVQLLHGEDLEGAKTLVSYAFRILMLLAVALLLVAVTCSWSIPWTVLFKSEAVSQGEYAVIFALCLGALAVGLPSRLGSVVFTAHGNLQALPLSELVAQVGAFAMLLLAVGLRWKSLLALVACSVVSIAAVPMVLTFLAFWRLRYQVYLPARPPTEDRRALLGQGGFFFLTTIGELLILQSDSLLIGIVRGASVVPLFMIPAALWLNFLQAQNIFLRPLWPLLSKAQAEQNTVFFREYIKRTILCSLAGGVVFGGGLLLFGDWFIRWWSKGAAGLPPLMALGFAAYVVVASFDNVLAMILNATGMIAQRFRYTLLFGVAKLLVGWVALTWIGIEALPLAYAVVMLMISLPFGVIYVRLVVRRMES